MIFVDTNIFLRFFLKDHPQQFTKAEKLFRKAAKGRVKLWTTEWVIAEIYWVLSSGIPKLEKASIFEFLGAILEFKGLEVRNKNQVTEAILLAEAKNVEIGDAFNAILIREEGIKQVYSFDKHFNRIPGLKRKEP